MDASWITMAIETVFQKRYELVAKRFIKRMLLALGIWYPVRRFIKRNFQQSGSFQEKYGKRDTWTFPLATIDLQFSVSDAYSKRWFFPRYDKNRYHEPAVTKLFMELVGEKDVVMDIGVHLGYFTCLSAVLAKQGSVHSFEVDPTCIPLIQQNIRKNRLTNVTLHNKAVSDQVGTEKIPLGAGPNASLKLQHTQDAIDVASTTVDRYIETTGITPTLIKIDVEGAEEKVLKGMGKTLQKDGIVLLIEIHVKELTAYFDTDYTAILEALLSHGFSVYEVKEHRSNNQKLKKLTTKSRLQGNAMVYCVKE